MTEPRFRINVSQTAKGLHQFDCTIELDSNIFKNINEVDAADIKIETIGKKLLDVLKDAEKQFKEDGRKLVTDE